MPANVVNRQTIREALATLIDNDFNSDWDVFNYKTPKFNGKARNIVVSSAGSGRNIMGARPVDPDTVFRFRVFVFIRYSDDANSWTAKNSEDALDLAEKDLTDLLTDNYTSANWERLTIEGESDPDNVIDEGGQVFRREIITVRTEILT